jgi:hypothetical protein
VENHDSRDDEGAVAQGVHGERRGHDQGRDAHDRRHTGIADRSIVAGRGHGPPEVDRSEELINQSQKARLPTMLRTTAKRTRLRSRLDVEPLEARELLSGSHSSRANAAGHASSSAPLPITLTLAAEISPAGSYVDVASARVVLNGQTAPGATVLLERPTTSGDLKTVARTTANAQGDYGFSLNCGMGTTELTAKAIAVTGAQGSASLNVTRANQAIVWNSIALQAVRTAHEQAPNAARDYAIVALAVFDAVNAIAPRYASYGGIAVKAPRGASPDAAADAAAETVLASSAWSMAD